MKTSFAKIFLVVFMLFSFQNVNAADCSSKSPVSLNDLGFVGTTFVGALAEIGRGPECKVVEGTRTDGVANVNCNPGVTDPQKRIWVAVNPGNPNYLTDEKLQSIPGGEKENSHKYNKLNYYFCMRMNKKSMCIEREKRLKKENPKLIVKYEGAGNNDGECYCSTEGKPGKKICPVEITPVVDSNLCQNDPDKTEKDGKCYCKSDGSESKKGEACPKQAENPKDMDIENCIKDLKEARDKCANQSRTAINKCNKDAPEFNKNVDTAQQVLNFGIDALVAKKAGTGALDTCVRMGAAGTVIVQALNIFRDNCSKEVKACKDACEDAATLSKKSDEDYIKECKAMAAGNSEAKDENEAPATSYAWTEKIEANLVERLKELKGEAESANTSCVADVKNEKFDLDNFFGQLDENVRQANICECKLSTSTGQIDRDGNCDGLIGPAGCIVNPVQAGCGFSTVGCAPNSTLPGCRIVNQVAAAPTGGLNAPPAGFAGGGFAGSGGGGGTLKPSGGITLSDGDLDALNGEKAAVSGSAAVGDSGSPFGGTAAAGGGGGGFGGGGGGDDGSGGPAATEEDKDKGLSGLFNNARSSIANLFGGPTARKGNAIKKGQQPTYKEVNALRPKAGVRGVAEASEVGGKNRDIWKAMSDRYNDQYHTFITVEGK